MGIMYFIVKASRKIRMKINYKTRIPEDCRLIGEDVLEMREKYGLAIFLGYRSEWGWYPNKGFIFEKGESIRIFGADYKKLVKFLKDYKLPFLWKNYEVI